MKNFWKFGIGLFFSVGLLVALSISWDMGDRQIPPLGNFLNPFTGFWNLAESGKSGSHENISTLSIDDTIQIEFDKRFVPIYIPKAAKMHFMLKGIYTPDIDFFKWNLQLAPFSVHFPKFWALQPWKKIFSHAGLTFLRLCKTN